MNKHKSNKIIENSNTVRHLIMGQITTTRNLVAIKEVRHAGQKPADIVTPERSMRVYFDDILYKPISVLDIMIFMKSYRLPCFIQHIVMQTTKVVFFNPIIVDASLRVVSRGGHQQQNDMQPVEHGKSVWMVHARSVTFYLRNRSNRKAN